MIQSLQLQKLRNGGMHGADFITRTEKARGAAAGKGLWAASEAEEAKDFKQGRKVFR